MIKKTISILILVSIMTIAPSQFVHAQGQPQNIGNYDYAIYGPEGRVLYVYETFNLSTSGLSPSVNMVQPLASSGCLSYSLGKAYKNALGMFVLQYTQQITWCFNGSKITSVSHQHIPTVYFPLYKFNGIIGDNHSGGVGYSSFHAFSQASFCETAPLIGCVWYVYPWVDQTVYGNGNYSGSAGG
jgi:hypothetical protein